MEERATLTIGQISKVCGVSMETLCHYDRIGPLKPQRMDRIDGCWCCEGPQIGAMLLVGRLRRHGFSLTKIQALFTVPDSRELLQQLYKQGFHLERQIEHISVTIKEMGYHLEGFERTGDTMSYRNDYKIQIKGAEEQALVTQRNKMSVEKFGTYCGKIYEKIVRKHMAINGVVIVACHDQESNLVYSDAGLGVEIIEQGKADFVASGCLCATTIHKGAYSGLPNAYGATVAWISTNEHHMNGMPYEIYRKTQFGKLPSEKWETEISFPVRK